MSRGAMNPVSALTSPASSSSWALGKYASLVSEAKRWFLTVFEGVGQGKDGGVDDIAVVGNAQDINIQAPDGLARLDAKRFLVEYLAPVI